MPLLSIITINYNNREGLERTFTSIANQTWKEFEYIVVDGGSQDGSTEFLKSNKSEIDVLISEPDSGIYNAMNKGIKVSSGNYLLFINSGDELNSSTILEEVKDLIHTVDLIYFNISLILKGETKIHEYPEKLDYKSFKEGAIGHPSTFIKKDLFERVGIYDENLKIVADWKFFFLAVVKYNCTTKKVDTVLSKFHMDGISSTESEIVEKEREKVLMEYFDHYERLYEMESILKNLKRSRSMKILQKIGLFKILKTK